MFKQSWAFLKKLFSKETKTFSSEEETYVAIAALMHHIINADGISVDSECLTLKRILVEITQISDTDLDRIVEAGKDLNTACLDIDTLTLILQKNLDHDRLIQLVKMMERIIYADGKANELEHNTLWRIRQLTGANSKK